MKVPGTPAFLSRQLFRPAVVALGTLLLGISLTGCSTTAAPGSVSVELGRPSPSANDGQYLVRLDQGETHLSQRLSANSSYMFPAVAEGKIKITIEGHCTFWTSLGTEPVRAIVDRKHCTLSG